MRDRRPPFLDPPVKAGVQGEDKSPAAKAMRRLVAEIERGKSFDATSLLTTSSISNSTATANYTNAGTIQ